MEAVTVSVIAFTTLVLVLYDVFALISGGQQVTISAVLARGAMRYPVISLAWGVLTGHLFWPNPGYCP